MQALDDDLPTHYQLVRSRLVRLDATMLDPSNEARAAEIRLNFFPDSTFDVTELLSKARGEGQGFKWYGRWPTAIPRRPC